MQMNPQMASKVLSLGRIAQYYVNATLGYGFARAATYDYKGTKNYYNTNTMQYETKEMLLTDKLSRILAGSFAAITMWPLMVWEDARRLEFAVTGKDAAEFTEN